MGNVRLRDRLSYFSQDASTNTRTVADHAHARVGSRRNTRLTSTAMLRVLIAIFVCCALLQTSAADSSVEKILKRDWYGAKSAHFTLLTDVSKGKNPHTETAAPRVFPRGT